MATTRKSGTVGLRQKSVKQEHLTIAVMGATGTGKSSFINLASGSNLRVGNGLRSCTSTVKLSNPFRVEGRPVVLIDTPGFDDTIVTDTDILKEIGLYMASTFEIGHKLSGIIYMHRITDLRMGGTSRKNFSLFRKLCGDSTLKNVIIATNMWSQVDLAIGEARERELATDDILFKPVLGHGARMRRHTGSKESALEILSKIVFNHPVPLLIQEELVEQKRDITETTAGGELDKELAEIRKRQKEELRELKEQLAEARATSDVQTQEELEKEHEEIEDRARKLEESRAMLSQRYAEEKVKADDELRRLMEELRVQAGALLIPEIESESVSKMIGRGDTDAKGDTATATPSALGDHTPYGDPPDGPYIPRTWAQTPQNHTVGDKPGDHQTAISLSPPGSSPSPANAEQTLNASTRAPPSLTGDVPQLVEQAAPSSIPISRRKPLPPPPSEPQTSGVCPEVSLGQERGIPRESPAGPRDMVSAKAVSRSSQDQSVVLQNPAPPRASGDTHGRSQVDNPSHERSATSAGRPMVARGTAPKTRICVVDDYVSSHDPKLYPLDANQSNIRAQFAQGEAVTNVPVMQPGNEFPVGGEHKINTGEMPYPGPTNPTPHFNSLQGYSRGNGGEWHPQEHISAQGTPILEVFEDSDEWEDVVMDEPTLLRVLEMARARFQAEMKPQIQEMREEIDRLQAELMRSRGNPTQKSRRRILEGFGAAIDAFIYLKLLPKPLKRKKASRH